MIVICCSIRDSALGSFQRPFFVPTVGVAIRGFGDEVARGGDSVLSAHPEDYELFELAHFDEVSGRFTNLSDPRSLARGKDFERGGDRDASVDAASR